MNKQAKTIKLSGKDYAQVAERIRLFREDCPRGLIETTPTIGDNGKIMFKARVLKDKGSPESAEATAHAIGEDKGVKAFEKLESIAVGRALAMLGYLASGEIASGEEMEEFLEYQDKKIKEEIDAIQSLEELRLFYLKNKGKGADFDKYVTLRKEQIQNENT